MATLEETKIVNGTKPETTQEDGESDHQEVEDVEAATEGNPESKSKKKKKKKKKTGAAAQSTNGHVQLDNGSENATAEPENDEENEGDGAANGKQSFSVVKFLILKL